MISFIDILIDISLVAVSCPKLNTSKTVHANVSAYQYGSTVEFSCKHADYVLSGEKSISCKENGDWSAKVPECLGLFRVDMCITVPMRSPVKKPLHD